MRSVLAYMLLLILFGPSSVKAEVFRRRRPTPLPQTMAHGPLEVHSEGTVRPSLGTPPLAAASLPTVKTEKGTDGLTYAFQKRDSVWVPYAVQLQDEEGAFFWELYPLRNGQWVPLTALQKRAAQSRHLADKHEKLLRDQQTNPEVQKALNNPGAAFQRFKEAYGPHLPTTLPESSEIVRRTGFHMGPRGAHVVVAPADPHRPGVVITADETHLDELDATVATLRDATSEELKTRKDHGEAIGNLRANSYVIVKPGRALEKGLSEARIALSSLPDQVAANAVVQAKIKSGPGPLASAERRVERAARRGLGRRRFEEGLREGLPQAVSGATKAVNDTVDLISEKAKSSALTGAARMEARAIEVGKPTDLLGFEVDFLNHKDMGVEYTLTTDQGNHYFIRNLGKNYSDEKGPYVPAFVYGRFNVAILEAYEKHGKITETDLHRIAEANRFTVSESGELIYRR